MRTLLLLSLIALVARADDNTVNEGVVKDVRALLSAVKRKDIESAKQKLFARTDLDWLSVKEGLMTGRYYRAPLSTNYGTRHSGKHMRIRLTGRDGKERGFSLYVPKSYDAKSKIPVLFYLHHRSGLPNPSDGATVVHSAIVKFRDAAEEAGILFVAPYTSAGAQWWLPEGRRLVAWTLEQVKQRYNIDEDRVALVGVRDGAEGVWAIAQEMPGIWSCMIPMSGDPYEITGLVRPLYLGTLDRMDVFIGVPGRMRGTLGDKSAHQFLAALMPMINQGMRINTAIAPRSQGDFRYLVRVRDEIMSWVLTKKRKALANEVDIESENGNGLRSLWLETHGVDPEGEVFHRLPTTRLIWNPPANEKQADQDKEPPVRMGVEVDKKPKDREFGLGIKRATGATNREGVIAGDILVEVDGVTITKLEEVKAALKKFGFDDEVKIVVLREVKESELAGIRKRQALYMKMAVRRRELRAEGKPVPDDLLDRMEEEEDGEEDEDDDDDDGCTEIDMGGDDEGKDESEKTFFVPLVRYLQLRRPEVGKLVRADFGATIDRGYKKHGVKLAHLYAGGHAARSGFKKGDIIVAVGSDTVARPRDINDFFRDFKFEKEEKGKRFAEFTVKRGDNEQTVHVSWEPIVSSRVDVKWKKEEKILEVSCRHANRFTIYFTDEHIKPGEEFHLYINGVPYKDLVDPASRPDYAVIDVGTDPFVKEELRAMLQKRAKVKGWQPDIKWAVENALAQRDRSLIVGAKRTFDLTEMSRGFLSWKERVKKIKADRAVKIQKAYEEHKSKG